MPTQGRSRATERREIAHRGVKTAVRQVVPAGPVGAVVARLAVGLEVHVTVVILREQGGVSASRARRSAPRSAETERRSTTRRASSGGLLGGSSPAPDRPWSARRRRPCSRWPPARAAPAWLNLRLRAEGSGTMRLPSRSASLPRQLQLVGLSLKTPARGYC